MGGPVMVAIVAASLAACFLVSGLLANLATAFGWPRLRDSMWAMCCMCLFTALLWGVVTGDGFWVGK